MLHLRMVSCVMSHVMSHGFMSHGFMSHGSRGVISHTSHVAFANGSRACVQRELTHPHTHTRARTQVAPSLSHHTQKWWEWYASHSLITLSHRTLASHSHITLTHYTHASHSRITHTHHTHASHSLITFTHHTHASHSCIPHPTSLIPLSHHPWASRVHARIHTYIYTRTHVDREYISLVESASCALILHTRTYTYIYM